MDVAMEWTVMQEKRPEEPEQVVRVIRQKVRIAVAHGQFSRIH